MNLILTTAAEVERLAWHHSTLVERDPATDTITTCVGRNVYAAALGGAS